jgi:hypothetical protein
MTNGVPASFPGSEQVRFIETEPTVRVLDLP